MSSSRSFWIPLTLQPVKNKILWSIKESSATCNEFLVSLKLSKVKQFSPLILYNFHRWQKRSGEIKFSAPSNAHNSENIENTLKIVSWKFWIFMELEIHAHKISTNNQKKFYEDMCTCSSGWGVNAHIQHKTYSCAHDIFSIFPQLNPYRAFIWIISEWLWNVLEIWCTNVQILWNIWPPSQVIV